MRKESGLKKGCLTGLAILGGCWLLGILLIFLSPGDPPGFAFILMLISPFVAYYATRYTGRKDVEEAMQENRITATKNLNSHFEADNIDARTAKYFYLSKGDGVILSVVPYPAVAVALTKENKQVHIYTLVHEKGNYNVTSIEAKSLIEVKVIVDDVVVQSQTSTGAIVGGHVGGALGSIVGAAFSTPGNSYISSVYIRIITKDLINPMVSIKLIDEKCTHDSPAVKEAKRFSDEVYGLIVALLHISNEQASANE